MNWEHSRLFYSLLIPFFVVFHQKYICFTFSAYLITVMKTHILLIVKKIFTSVRVPSPSGTTNWIPPLGFASTNSTLILINLPAKKEIKVSSSNVQTKVHLNKKYY